ncbi:hypothetical protein PG997_014339 [Apiospora hydei]|uniref:RING-type domain-containing protein n=1 Tax=Apiospora hydei TaxID=1337664 RepID=A0ABR1UU65_9PEZI
MAASGQVEEIGTNFILPVVEHLEKAGQPGAPILEIACGICLWRTLDISTKVGGLIEAECRLRPEDAAQSKDDFYEKHQLEYTIFLKCGHLVGATCWEAQMERPDFSTQQCNFCKTSLLCDGCPSRILMDDRFDPVQWPLDPASYRPYEEFQTRVGLTVVEVDPDALRFCGPCARYQVRRKFAELLLTFPRCHADECFPRPRTAASSSCRRCRRRACPTSSGARRTDVRDPQIRAELEAEFGATRRTVQQSLSMFAPRVRAAGQLAFRPCRDPGNGSNGGAGTRLVTAQQVSEALAMAEAHLRQFYDNVIDRLPAVWYRGGGVPFQRHPPEYQVEVPDVSESTRRAVRYLLMTVGADSVEEAQALIHPSVIAGSSMNEIIGRAQTIVVIRPDEFQ